MARPKAELVLSAEERDELISLTRKHRTVQALAMRARLVLACAGGMDNKAVAAYLGVSEPTVCKWRARFVRERTSGIYDEPRPGAPRKISDAKVEQVVATTLESTPRNATHWSSRSMAKKMGIGRSAARQKSDLTTTRGMGPRCFSPRSTQRPAR